MTERESYLASDSSMIRNAADKERTLTGHAVDGGACGSSPGAAVTKTHGGHGTHGSVLLEFRWTQAGREGDRTLCQGLETKKLQLHQLRWCHGSGPTRLRASS